MMPKLGQLGAGCWTVRLYRRFLFATALVTAGSPSVHSSEMDTAKITCRAFLASGRDNMGAIFMWLRGYHAGKTGVIPFQSSDPYAARLGLYCGQHPDANLIEASEQILTDLDHGT